MRSLNQVLCRFKPKTYRNTRTFTYAVIAGDLAKAQKLYTHTHVHWERTEPIAERWKNKYPQSSFLTKFAEFPMLLQAGDG
ncbi:MAG: hypothetical protein HC903_26105 [Methylacidiphilales bacterium]|nr:hypothetical protein [Candidatus Methylacidiphilales bacterium]NJR14808.1 hypothetical protein [Calothrix sp. CSU_2_0]